MKTFIIIITLYINTGYGAGVTTTQYEKQFSSIEECRRETSAVATTLSQQIKSNYACVEK